MGARRLGARAVRAVVMMTTAALAVVATGCTGPSEPPTSASPPSSSTPAPTDRGVPVVDASAELDKLPNVERFVEQAVDQVRQEYPDKVPKDFTAASVLAELEAIDEHMDADGVLDHAAAAGDPAVATDTLDSYARTYRALGGVVSGVGEGRPGSENGHDDVSIDGASHDAGSPVTGVESSAIRFVSAGAVTGEESEDPRDGYDGPRQFVSGKPERADEYEKFGDAVLQGQILYFESEYSLGRLSFEASLDRYLQDRLDEGQSIVAFGGVMDGPLGRCIVDSDVYFEQTEQGATDAEVCLTRTVGGAAAPEPPTPLDSTVQESAGAVDADLQELIIRELWPIVKGLIGLEDLEKCFSEADILACVMTLVNVLPVGKAIKVVRTIPAVVKAVEKIVKFTATKGKKLPVVAPAGCFASFAGSTPVLMADGTHQPIRDVRPGDYVRATDPESGLSGPRRVLDTFVHQDTLVDLGLVGGDSITTTADHPFWSATDRMFEDAQELAPGERVLAADGTERAVTGLESGTAREGAAYNLAVAGLHAYFVGPHEVLVHNRCPVGRLHGPAMTREGVEASFRELAPGRHSKSVRTVGSVDELRRLFDSWTAGAERLESRTPKVPEVYKLPDGTVIQWRISSKSGGETIDITGGGKKILKVHLDD